ncbi:ABC transporter ATP-binding protein [Fulvivirgaceae bacterium BMA12]|uniref:ABC transporter ATP-binding protein n=1 Tax=Agaribacillus aureus TaxID=3051825 RepID=A0ABT8L3U2_9BACT|nr:ABC transporter ATP-binding protein [Fulvivirgaceae bacterium BMA12]
MKLISRIFQFARPFRASVPQYIVYTFFGIIFGVGSLALIIPFLEVIFDQLDAEKLAQYQHQPPFEWSVTYIKNLFYYYFLDFTKDKDKLTSLLFVCSVLITVNFLGNLFKYLSAVMSAVIRARLVRKLRDAIYEKINHLDMGFFTNERKGDTISRITNDVQEVERSAMYVIQVVFKEPVTIIVYFGILFIMQWELTLLSMLILPVAGGIISGIAKRLKKAAILNQESIGRILNVVEESLSGMRVIKAFTASNYMLKKFKEEDRIYAGINVSMAKRFELASPLSEFFGIITISGILLIGGNLIFGGSMDSAEFIGYLIIFSQVLTPAKEISKAISAIQKGNASAERIFSILDTEPVIKDVKDAIDVKEFNQNIAFKSVSFAYDQDKQVLADINFDIEKGKTVALVGPSGGGKSTIADLIPRFYDPDQGEILLDGKNIKDIKVESLRKMMGIVTQESILFNDTVLNNIAFGIENADEEAVIKAAKIANAHEFITKMEHGYQTMVGERGLKMSGGQRQRLSIARAVFKNPPILILDEATSALDSESEKLVQNALGNLMQNRTSVVIAHRLSTIQHADEILVVKEGKIVERGSHDELLAVSGLYSKLIEMQTV